MVDDGLKSSSGRMDALVEPASECPECGESVFTDDQGEVICSVCGLVVDDINVRSNKKRAYDMNEKNSRTHTGPGENSLLHDNGLSTKISERNKDAYGRQVSSRKSYSLRKWNRRMRISDSRSKTLANGLDYIRRIGSVMDIPRSIRKKAGKRYRELMEKSKPRGRSTEDIIIATLYLVCREEQIPRTIDEFAEIADKDSPKIHKLYKDIKRRLSIPIKLVQPEKYIDKICNHLSIDSEVRKDAKALLEEARKYNIQSGKSPNGLAGGAVYLASENNKGEITQSDISDIADVTEVTIRTRYMELEEMENN